MIELNYTVRLAVLSAKVKVVQTKNMARICEQYNIDNQHRSGFTHYRAGREGAEVLIVLTEQDLGLVAHECVHAATYIQEHMHTVPSWQNDELTAYIVGYLVSEYLKQLKKAEKCN